MAVLLPVHGSDMKLVGVFLVLSLLTGCGQTTLTNSPAGSSPPSIQASESTVNPSIPAGESILLTTEDNVHLAANLYPSDGDVAVVFAHMGIADQTSWSTFASDIAQAGMPALTFDFRCFGKSECFTDYTQISNVKDVRAGIAYLRSQGYQRIACVGASMGATACLNATLQEELAGLVFIAGDTALRVSSLSYPEDMVSPGMPKLFIVADNDPYGKVIADTLYYYEISPQPKGYIHYPEMAHGTELFNTAHGS